MFLHKKLIVAGGVVLGLTAGGVAYAAFTASGTGGGNATVTGTVTRTPVTVTLHFQPETVLSPDADPVDVLADFDNPNTKAVFVGPVDVIVEGVTPNTCPAAGFVFKRALDAQGNPLAFKVLGNHVPVRDKIVGKLALVDDQDLDQRTCTGATVTLGASTTP